MRNICNIDFNNLELNGTSNIATDTTELLLFITPKESQKTNIQLEITSVHGSVSKIDYISNPISLNSTLFNGNGEMRIRLLSAEENSQYITFQCCIFNNLDVLYCKMNGYNFKFILGKRKGGETELPIASQDVLGGIKVGENLSIEPDGTLKSVGTMGPIGPKGDPGERGTDGKSSYLHIKYSSVQVPQSQNDISDIPNEYMGIYVDFIQESSNDPFKYLWYRIKGNDGEKGATGNTGPSNKLEIGEIIEGDSASANIRGEPPNQILDLTLPRGPQGPVGPSGGFNIDMVYPVGAIYISVLETSPSELFGGTWERFANGKTLVGVDENDNDFITVKKTGGEKTHTLTVAEMPTHTHAQNAHSHSGSSGSSGAHTHTVSASASSAGGHGHTASCGSAGAHAHTSSAVGWKSGANNWKTTGYTGSVTNWGYDIPTHSAGAHGHSISIGSGGAHTHSVSGSAASAGGHTHTISVGNTTAVNQNTGLSGSHNNLQPYITVYMWVRTA